MSATINAAVVLAALDNILEPMTTHPKTHLTITRNRVRRLRAQVEQQGSRNPEAAPSDTDPKAAIEAVAQVMFEPPSLGQDDPEYTWAQMVLEDPSRADMYRQDAAAALEAASRTSQPVQVEATTVEELEALPVGSVVRAADGDVCELMEVKFSDQAFGIRWRSPGWEGVLTAPDIALPATVLHRPAALGGGDHE